MGHTVPVATLMLLAALLAACGEGTASTTTDSSATGPTTPTTSTTEAPPGPGPTFCEYYDVVGCVLYGLVLAEPRPLVDALSAVEIDLPGTPIAVWRSDFVCALQVTMGAPGPVPTEPSRFAYVDADGIRERRLQASGTVAPPITGMMISESYWNRWEDQWAQTQRALIEAVAVFLPEAAITDGPPAGYTAAIPIAWRRTDTLNPAAYPGELLVASEEFPAGYLSEPAPLACG